MRILLFVIPVVMLLAVSSNATVITIDLRQPEGTESGSNISGDTWRWGGGDPRYFDLEFGSGNGSHVDLDGGVAVGNEYFQGYGSMAATDHTYDLLKVEYQGGDLWSLSGSRDGSTFTPIGSITEYSGTIDHVTNYGYETAGADQSDPVNGPAGAGVNYTVWEPWKAWLWIYRDTTADTISLNVVTGSAGVPPSGSGTINDGGNLNAEITISGLYTGIPVELVGNEPGEVTGTNPFLLRNNWDSAFDDGAVVAGITPMPIPEPATLAILAIGGLALLWKRK